MMILPGLQALCMCGHQALCHSLGAAAILLCRYTQPDINAVVHTATATSGAWMLSMQHAVTSLLVYMMCN